MLEGNCGSGVIGFAVKFSETGVYIHIYIYIADPSKKNILRILTDVFADFVCEIYFSLMLLPSHSFISTLKVFSCLLTPVLMKECLLIEGTGFYSTIIFCLHRLSLS